MSIAQSLLPEFDHEMAGTRKTIERIPDDKLDWKAHPKSNTIGWVAAHLANIVKWTDYTLTSDSLDIAPPGKEPMRTPVPSSIAEILETFDKNLAISRAKLVEASDEELMKPWSLLSGGQTVLTMPKIGVLRTFVLNHSIHHRGHLCVYLRLNDIPVPALYGPSADENG
jgi:uncharacterized damage-inducible protein DinB